MGNGRGTAPVEAHAEASKDADNDHAEGRKTLETAPFNGVGVLTPRLSVGHTLLKAARWSKRSSSTRRTSRSRSSTGRRRSRCCARARSRSSLCTTGRSGRFRSASSCLPSSASFATSRSSGGSITSRFRGRTSTRATITAASTARSVFPTSELTFDHVVPVAQGGRKDWENIVTCCVSCNRRKGGRTPAEAGMHLVKTPAAPRVRAGHSHHDRTAKRARQLARLPLLERRARRNLGTVVTQSRVYRVQPHWADRRRPRHHPRIRIS